MRFFVLTLSILAAFVVQTDTRYVKKRIHNTKEIVEPNFGSWGQRRDFENDVDSENSSDNRKGTKDEKRRVDEENKDEKNYRVVVVGGNGGDGGNGGESENGEDSRDGGGLSNATGGKIGKGGQGGQGGQGGNGGIIVYCGYGSPYNVNINGANGGSAGKDGGSAGKVKMFSKRSSGFKGEVHEASKGAGGSGGVIIYCGYGQPHRAKINERNRDVHN